MSIEAIQGYSQRELEQFKTVCNLLLSRTYIVRMTYQPDKGLISNPNYLFLMTKGLKYQKTQFFKSATRSFTDSMILRSSFIVHCHQRHG